MRVNGAIDEKAPVDETMLEAIPGDLTNEGRILYGMGIWGQGVSGGSFWNRAASRARSAMLKKVVR